MPFLPPNQQRQSTEGIAVTVYATKTELLVASVDGVDKDDHFAADQPQLQQCVHQQKLLLFITPNDKRTRKRAKPDVSPLGCATSCLHPETSMHY